jgi:hypothetical protein
VVGRRGRSRHSPVERSRHCSIRRAPDGARRLDTRSLDAAHARHGRQAGLELVAFETKLARLPRPLIAALWEAIDRLPHHSSSRASKTSNLSRTRGREFLRDLRGGSAEERRPVTFRFRLSPGCAFVDGSAWWGSARYVSVQVPSREAVVPERPTPTGTGQERKRRRDRSRGGERTLIRAGDRTRTGDVQLGRQSSAAWTSAHQRKSPELRPCPAIQRQSARLVCHWQHYFCGDPGVGHCRFLHF